MPLSRMQAIVTSKGKPPKAKGPKKGTGKR